MDLIGQVLEAGRMSPTAGNLQNYKIILVRDKGKRRGISEACLDQHWMASAPVHLVVVSEPQRARQFYYERGEKLYSIQNCAAIAMCMELAAWSLGLATCWVGAFDPDKLASVIGCPDRVDPQVVLTMGYPDEKVPIPDRYKLWDMVFVEAWEKRIMNVPVSAMRELSPVLEARFKEGKKRLEAHAESLIGKIKDRTLDLKKKVGKKLRERNKR